MAFSTECFLCATLHMVTESSSPPRPISHEKSKALRDTRSVLITNFYVISFPITFYLQ